MKICCPPCAVYFHEGAGVPRGPASRPAAARGAGLPQRNPAARAGSSPPAASAAGTRCCAGRRPAPRRRRSPPRHQGPRAWTASDPARRAAPALPARNSSQPSSLTSPPRARRGALEQSARRRGPARLDSYPGPVVLPHGRRHVDAANKVEDAGRHRSRASCTPRPAATTARRHRPPSANLREARWPQMGGPGSSRP